MYYDYQLDPEAISKLLEQLDDDIAQRIVASAISMDPEKLMEAIRTGAQEQDVRTEKKRREATSKAEKPTEGTETPEASTGAQTNSEKLLEGLQLFLGPLFNSGSKKD